MGYYRAGFDVVGVDILPQPNYPFKFHQEDALETLTGDLSEYQAIHASPPCQAYSLATLHRGQDYANTLPDLIEPTRRLLREHASVPWVMENVPRAPIAKHVLLCGEMFGLRLHRHRYFEIDGFMVMQPRHAPHTLRGALDNCHIEDGYTRQIAGHYADHKSACEAMGIDWMTPSELVESIPPAYTEHIGDYLLRTVGAVAV